MRLLISVLIIFFCTSGLSSAESLPPKVVDLMDDYQKASAKIIEEALEDIAKERKSVIRSLEKEQKREVKKGELDTALAIKHLVSELSQPIVESPELDKGLVDLFGTADAGQHAQTGRLAGGVQIGDLDAYIVSFDMMKDDKVIKHFSPDGFTKFASLIAERSKRKGKAAAANIVNIEGVGDGPAVKKELEKGHYYRMTVRIAGKIEEFLSKGIMLQIDDLPVE